MNCCPSAALAIWELAPLRRLVADFGSRILRYIQQFAAQGYAPCRPADPGALGHLPVEVTQREPYPEVLADSYR
jgi:hypothetical protein